MYYDQPQVTIAVNAKVFKMVECNIHGCVLNVTLIIPLCEQVILVCQGLNLFLKTIHLIFPVIKTASCFSNNCELCT